MSDLLNKLRTPRIFGIALFDLILALVCMMYLFHAMGWGAINGALLAIPVGILVHYILDIPTRLNYYLGISCEP